MRSDITAKRWQRRSRRLQMQENTLLAKSIASKPSLTKVTDLETQPQQHQPEPQIEPLTDMKSQPQWIMRDENVCLSTQASQLEESQETLIQSPRKAAPRQLDEMQTQIYKMQTQIEKLTDIIEQEVSARTRLVRKLDGELKRERVRLWALSQN